MKITILQGAFLPIPAVLGGGAEKMWYALALEFVRQGHQVVYVSRCYPGMPDEEWQEGVFHKRVKGYDWPHSLLKLKWLDLLYTLRAKNVIPQDSDVVVTNTFWSPILLSRQLRKRCVVDVARMPKGQMWLYREAARLRANSSPVAAAIRKELPLHQHQRIITIPNPLPFTPEARPALEQKQAVLLYTGRLHPEKGLHLLIQAFRELPSSWKLKIVGPWEKSAGGGGEHYLEHLKRLAGPSAIEFTGAIHDIERLNHHYAEASIFVYPSLAEKGETFGMSPLEAMSWGCVPLVSDLACFRDFIRPGENGLVFNHRATDPARVLRNAMADLILDPKLRQCLSQEALKVQQSHSTSHIASCFLEEFEQIVAEKNNLNPELV